MGGVKGQWRRPDGEIDHERVKSSPTRSPQHGNSPCGGPGRHLDGTGQKFEQESVLWESARVCIAS